MISDEVTKNGPPRPPLALVTGGAVRVGRSIVLALAEAGFDIALNYRSSEANARETARDVEACGRDCLLLQGDLSMPSEIERIAEEVRASAGGLDLLVNNAALFESTPFADVDLKAWDRVMAVNLRAPFLLAQALNPLLQTACGSIVNIVDLSAIEPWAEYPHHSVAKAGLLQLTRVMAKALAPGVRVNAIAPGTVLPPTEYDESRLKQERDRALLGKIGTPEDVARTVLFLADSPFITGELIVVDGGRRYGRMG